VAKSKHYSLNSCSLARFSWNLRVYCSSVCNIPLKKYPLSQWG
jgi:hypothetical protein